MKVKVKAGERVLYSGTLYMENGPDGDEFECKTAEGRRLVELGVAVDLNPKKPAAEKPHGK